MSDEIEPRRRRIWAQLGLCLMNLSVPGLGLWRLGRLWPFVAWQAAIPLLLGAMWVAAVAFGQQPLAFLIGMVAIILLLLAAVLLTIVWTWRASRAPVPAELPIWRRWYAILALAALSIAWYQVGLDLFGGKPVRGFWLPAQSMEPSALQGDHIWADMRKSPQIRAGQIVFFRFGEDTRINRVAAMPGDTVEMRGGLPVVNGLAPIVERDGSWRPEGELESAPRFRERFPGETGRHAMISYPDSEFADMPPVKVPAGHLFLLGDNRARSADSRVPKAMYGVGMVPIADVIGVPIVTYWSRDRSRIGSAP